MATIGEKFSTWQVMVNVSDETGARAVFYLGASAALVTVLKGSGPRLIDAPKVHATVTELGAASSGDCGFEVPDDPRATTLRKEWESVAADLDEERDRPVFYAGAVGAFELLFGNETSYRLDVRRFRTLIDEINAYNDGNGTIRTH